MKPRSLDSDFITCPDSAGPEPREDLERAVASALLPVCARRCCGRTDVPALGPEWRDGASPLAGVQIHPASACGALWRTKVHVELCGGRRCMWSSVEGEGG